MLQNSTYSLYQATYIQTADYFECITVSDLSFTNRIESTTFTVHKFKRYTHWGYNRLIHFLDAISLMVFSFTPLSFYPRHALNSRLSGLHILFAWFGAEKPLLPLPGVEPRLLGFTICRVGTVLIMLTKFPLLEISWFFIRGSYKGRGAACNCVQFNIKLIPGLLLLFNIL